MKRKKITYIYFLYIKLHLFKYICIIIYTKQKEHRKKILLLDCSQENWVSFISFNNFFVSQYIIVYPYDICLAALIIFFSLWCLEILQVVGIGYFLFGEYRERTSSGSKRPCFDKRHTIAVRNHHIYMCVCEREFEDFLLGGGGSFSFFLKVKSAKGCVWRSCPSNLWVYI